MGVIDPYRRNRIVFRLALFAIAAVLLAWRCREGASTFEVGVFSVFYVFAATLWIRGQYEAAADAFRKGDLRPWTPSTRICGTVALFGASFAAWGVEEDHGTPLLAGTIAAYLGVGYALMRFRLYPDPDGERTPQFRKPIDLPLSTKRLVGATLGCAALSVAVGVAKEWSACLLLVALTFFGASFVVDRRHAEATAEADVHTPTPEGPREAQGAEEGEARADGTAKRGRRDWSTGGGGLRLVVGGAFAGMSLLSLFFGLLFLEHGGKVAVAAVVVGVLAAPIGLAILAEPATRALQLQERKRFVPAPRLVAATGAVVFVACSATAAAWVGTPTVAVVAFVVLGLLVIAIVSSTQADIAIVIAVVCLLGVTATSEKKPAELSPEKVKGESRGQNVLVALGDSYMSGEGARIYYEEVDDNHCRRAPTAWAAVAGQTPRLFDSVEFLACSGARTGQVQGRGG